MTIKAVAHATLHHLKAHGLLHINHQDLKYHPFCCHITLSRPTATNWVTINFHDTYAIAYTPAAENSSTHHYADPNYLKTITRQVTDWLHEINPNPHIRQSSIHNWLRRHTKSKP